MSDTVNASQIMIFLHRLILFYLLSDIHSSQQRHKPLNNSSSAKNVGIPFLTSQSTMTYNRLKKIIANKRWSSFFLVLIFLFRSPHSLHFPTIQIESGDNKPCRERENKVGSSVKFTNYLPGVLVTLQSVVADRIESHLRVATRFAILIVVWCYYFMR